MKAVYNFLLPQEEKRPRWGEEKKTNREKREAHLLSYRGRGSQGAKGEPSKRKKEKPPP